MLLYMAEHAKTQLERGLRNKVFGNMFLTYLEITLSPSVSGGILYSMTTANSKGTRDPYPDVPPVEWNVLSNHDLQR